MQINLMDFAIFDSIYNRRTIDSNANPRRSEKRTGDVVQLYHFTRPQAMASIQNNGLNMGDVPVTGGLPPTREDFNNAVWLTEQGEILPQIGWAKGLNKTEVRITVRIERSDLNLWRWRDLARYLEVQTEWYQEINRSSGGFADKWFVYCNDAIPPSSIVEVKRYR